MIDHDPWADYAQEFINSDDYNPNDVPENFDASFYILTNDDLLDAGIDTVEEAIAHYLTFGEQEGRAVERVVGYGQDAWVAPDFDATWYMSAFPDLANAGIDTQLEAEEHYNNFGKSEGRPKHDIEWSTTNGVDFGLVSSSTLSWVMSFGPDNHIGIPPSYQNWVALNDFIDNETNPNWTISSGTRAWPSNLVRADDNATVDSLVSALAGDRTRLTSVV